MNLNLDNPKFHEEIFHEVGHIIKDCHNYLNDEEADKLEFIYTIFSLEKGWYSFNVFFQIGNKLFKTHQIKDKDSMESEEVILDCGIEFLKKIENIFESYKQPVPTQIKIQFSAITDEVKYNFKYDLFWSNKEGVMSEDIYNECFVQIKSGLEK